MFRKILFSIWCNKIKIPRTLFNNITNQCNFVRAETCKIQMKMKGTVRPKICVRGKRKIFIIYVDRCYLSSERHSEVIKHFKMLDGEQIIHQIFHKILDSHDNFSFIKLSFSKF